MMNVIQYWTRLRAQLTPFFTPLTSLWTARTAWLVIGLIALGAMFGWREVKFFVLVSAWTVAGVLLAFHARRFLVPEVKLSEYYDLVKAGNVAAAILAAALHLLQLGLVMLFAVALLHGAHGAPGA